MRGHRLEVEADMQGNLQRSCDLFQCPQAYFFPAVFKFGEMFAGDRCVVGKHGLGPSLL